MSRKLEILSRKTIFEKFIFRVEEVRLRHERFDGSMSEELTRLSWERGDSVAAVVHDIVHDTVVLVEQLRHVTMPVTGGWLAELPAGTMRPEENPEAALKRELMEETGYDVAHLEKISSLYLSPGGSSEQIHLYYAAVTRTDQTGAGGGEAGEGEDIRVRYVAIGKITEMIANGEIRDAKTLAGFQWLLLNRDRLSHTD